MCVEKINNTKSGLREWKEMVGLYSEKLAVTIIFFLKTMVTVFHYTDLITSK